MQVTIAASYGGQTQAARLTVNPIVPTSITLSPASLTFANQNVGISSSAQMVTLSNTGNAPLSISKVSISDGFAQSNNCGNSLAAQSNCSFGVTFVPTAPGSANGQLKIEDNASGSPHVVSLTGTALGPGVILSGNSLTFTGQVVGMTSGSQTLTLANTGNAPLTISNLAAAGDFAVATAGTNCYASSPVAAAGEVHDQCNLHPDDEREQDRDLNHC